MLVWCALWTVAIIIGCFAEDSRLWWGAADTALGLVLWVDGGGLLGGFLIGFGLAQLWHWWNDDGKRKAKRALGRVVDLGHRLVVRPEPVG